MTFPSSDYCALEYYYDIANVFPAFDIPTTSTYPWGTDLSDIPFHVLEVDEYGEPLAMTVEGTAADGTTGVFEFRTTDPTIPLSAPDTDEFEVTVTSGGETRDYVVTDPIAQEPATLTVMDAVSCLVDAMLVNLSKQRRLDTLAATTNWAGDDLQSTLNRAEAHIVSSSVTTMSYRSVGDDLLDALRRAFAALPVEVEFGLFDTATLPVEGDHNPPDMVFYTSWAGLSRDDRGFIPESPSANIDLREFGDAPVDRLPSVAVSYDGAQPRSGWAMRVVDNDHAEGKLLPLDGVEFTDDDAAEGFRAVASTEPDSLFRRYRPTVHFPKTGFTVVLPVGDYGIRLDFDDDNATVIFTVMTRSQLLIERGLEMMHKRRYGWLLSDCPPPDDAAVAAAVDAAMAQAANPHPMTCYVHY